MGLIGTILVFFLLGATIGIVEYIPTLKKEWKTAGQKEARASAERLLASREQSLSKEEPLQPAQARDYAFRDDAYYRTSQAAFERLGCTVLGDFALDQPEWPRPGSRSFVRVMRSGDRRVVCSILDATPHLIGWSALEKFHFYLAGTHKRYYKTISLRTELSDGTFIITATHSDLGIEELPPQIHKEVVPRDIAASELLKRHRDRVAKAATQANTTVVAIGTVEEYGQSYVRHYKTTRAFREKVGFALTDKEERALTESDSSHRREMSRIIFDTMRTLEAEKKKRAS